MKTLLLNVDGGSKGNPGPAGIGVVIRDTEGGILAEISESIGRATSNEAEYSALIRGLEACRDYEPDRVLVYSDSELLVFQMVGRYRVKKPHLVLLHRKATALARGFEKVAFKRVPRARNAHADRLAGQATKNESPDVTPSENLRFELLDDDDDSA